MQLGSASVGVVIFLLVFVLDIAHGFVRTRTVASLTESIGKLLVGSALSLLAAILLLIRP
jgi:hypothetical protein